MGRVGPPINSGAVVTRFIVQYMLLAFFALTIIITVGTLTVGGLTILGVVALIGWFILAGGLRSSFWFRADQ